MHTHHTVYIMMDDLSLSLSHFHSTQTIGFAVLCETVIFLATYIITPLTIVLSLLLSNALFWAGVTYFLASICPLKRYIYFPVRRLCPNLLPKARLLVAYHWKFLSRVWHGHEIIGDLQ